MPKSTIDDLLACYRLAGKLSKAHKSKLISLLTHDLGAQWGSAGSMVKRELKKKATKEEGQGT